MINRKLNILQIILFILFGLISFLNSAQQEAQFTQYMYATQIFNPAYSGNRGIMSLKFLGRSQWLDIDTQADFIRIDILSAYPGEEISGKVAFDECEIQEISFYGRDV